MISSRGFVYELLTPAPRIFCAGRMDGSFSIVSAGETAYDPPRRMQVLFAIRDFMGFLWLGKIGKLKMIISNTPLVTIDPAGFSHGKKTYRDRPDCLSRGCAWGYPNARIE